MAAIHEANPGLLPSWDRCSVGSTAGGEDQIHGFPSRMQSFVWIRLFWDVGVQGEAARQSQSHISWCEGALAAPLCFPEPEFQGLR